MSIVKKQHYVWRHYLRTWADNETIWAFFKELKRVEKPNLMGVAQERYFYKLIDFTEKEEIFLKNFIDKNSPIAVKDLNFDFLNLFTSTGKLKKQLEQNSNPDIDKEKIAEEIRKLEINLMEVTHGKMEALGFKLLEFKSLEELKTILQDDYIFDAIMFLCFQYFRTRPMKNSVIKSFEGDKFEDFAKKAWNILSYTLATTLAKSISLDKNLKFIFIENQTENHFITSDQPIFNILNDKFDKNGEINELELYYPISPVNSIIIHFRPEQKEQFVNLIASDENVEYYNKKVFENSEFYVFAKTEEQLNKMMENYHI
jgi:hypothetical protein